MKFRKDLSTLESAAVKFGTCCMLYFALPKLRRHKYSLFVMSCTAVVYHYCMHSSVLSMTVLIKDSDAGKGFDAEETVKYINYSSFHTL